MSSTNPKAEVSTAQIDARLDQLDKRIQSLRALYERYFNGVDRIPPKQPRKDVVRLMHELEHKTMLVNTAHKFRLRSLVQAFNTYRRYWDRTCKEIEEGTYRRDKLKAQRRLKYKKKHEEAKRQAAAVGEDEQGNFALDLDMDGLDDLDAFADSIFSSPPAKTPSPSQDLEPGFPPTPQPPSTPQPAMAASSAQDGEAKRRQKIMDLQSKLGLRTTGEVAAVSRQQPSHPASTPTPPSMDEDAKRRKLAAMRKKLAAKQSSELPSIPQTSSGIGDTPSSIRRAKLARLKTRIGSKAGTKMGAPRPITAVSGEQRVVQRRTAKPPTQTDAVEQVYKNLLEAKRRCNEPTQGLSYESVARSMAQQRDKYKEKGANNVDFKVVIKEGKAYLKPEPK